MKRIKTFEVLLNEDFFQANDILTIDAVGSKVEIISAPTFFYRKWYWRVLNFITFGFLFNVKCTYTVKLI